ncbi:hypothetical protein SAMN05444487_11751 [Marininema mesophilum]|uniref:Uncharacterized protein n=1 Tax=Marininema mesophilum TaxID=1048340 RepID=A0A1H3BLG1_9BACL|nr:hypothetical protein [Marininema mesophilum]SDX42812.1 hypothetical protein SAMN05444487_11751 [Marininema mesophilum]
MGDKIRPAGWYKTGKTLLLIWGIGTVCVSGIALAVLYPTYIEKEDQYRELKSLKTYHAKQQQTLVADKQKPVAPGFEELKGLQEKVPTDVDSARLLRDLTQVVEKAKATWVELRSADRLKDLKPLDEGKVKAETTVQRKEDDSSQNQVKEPSPPSNKKLQRYWGDLYVQVDSNSFTSLLQELEQLDRIIAVQGFEYVDQVDSKTGNLRIRFAYYAYKDAVVEKSIPKKDTVTDLSRQPSGEPSPPAKGKEYQKGNP